ncbi:caspase family protein [Spirosoma koreense]
MKRFTIILLVLLNAGYLRAQEQAVSTFKSATQRLNTESLFPKAVAPPQIEWRMGSGNQLAVEAENLTVQALIKTAKPLSSVKLYLNDELQPAQRDLKTVSDADQPFKQAVTLREGANKLRLVATNPGGESSSQFTVTYVKALPVEKRLALVIGNSAYPASSRLANPANDAQDMAKTLKDLGFEVMLYTDLTKKNLRKAVDDFGYKLKDYQVGLFFYAGHGVALADQNYLVPIDASPQTAGDIEFDCEPANRVVAKMEDARTVTNIIILDACRNNPFERSLSRGGGDGGLATMKSTSGSYIAYATAPGSTAADGTGRNGLYTAALLNNLKNPGLSIEDVFKRVRVDVQKQTNNRQRPWDTSSLTNDFYFKRK